MISRKLRKLSWFNMDTIILLASLSFAMMCVTQDRASGTYYAVAALLVREFYQGWRDFRSSRSTRGEGA